MKKFRTTITELILCNLFIISWYYSFQLTIEKVLYLFIYSSLILICYFQSNVRRVKYEWNSSRKVWGTGTQMIIPNQFVFSSDSLINKETVCTSNVFLSMQTASLFCFSAHLSWNLKWTILITFCLLFIRPSL